MAFTGVPVVKLVADWLVRITGVSLAAGANGTIGLFGDGGAGIQLPDAFNPTPYGTVTLVDALELDVNEAALSTPSGSTPNEAMFFGTTTGTGSAGNDYAATVAVGAAVPFPRAGPTTGGGIVAGGVNQFVLPTAGIYEVSWQVGFTEASQLSVALGGVLVANTNTTSGAGTQQNSNTVLVTATAGQLLSIVNPAGNAAALTVTPADGSLTHAQAPSLVIKLISPGPAGGGAADLAIVKAASPFRFTVTNNGLVDATAALEMYVHYHT